jgi:hypothetical protein
MVWQNELEEFIVTFYHSEWRRSDLIRRRFVEARKILGSARRWRPRHRELLPLIRGLLKAWACEWFASHGSNDAANIAGVA